MKKTLLMLIVTILLLPALASAVPFENILLEKSMDASFVAGSPQSIIVSFDNVDTVNQTFVFELNIRSGSSDYPVWKGDFDVNGTLKSSEFGTEKNYTLQCFEKFNGTFWCYNGTERLIPPKSHSVLTLFINSKPNLYTTDYTFDFKMYVDAGVEKNFVQSKVDVVSNEIKTIDIKNETNATIDIMTGQNVTGHVNVTTYNSLIIEPAFGLLELNKYLDVEVNQEFNSALCWVVIKIFYTEEDISAAGIDESTLRIWHYNVTSGEWVKESDSGVDTVNNYVWANVTHFSVYGVFGSSLPTTSELSTTLAISYDLPDYIKSMNIIAEESVEIVQGEVKDVEVSVENDGSVKLLGVSVTLTSISYDWFSPAALGDLSAGETKKIGITISVPETAEAGNYPAQIVATDSHGYTTSKDIAILVKEKTVPPTAHEEVPKKEEVPEKVPTPSPSPLTALIAVATSPPGIAVITLSIFIYLLVAYKLLSSIK